MDHEAFSKLHSKDRGCEPKLNKEQSKKIKENHEQDNTIIFMEGAIQYIQRSLLFDGF